MSSRYFRNLLYLSLLSYKDLIRQKVVFIFGLISFFLISLSVVMGALSFAEQDKILVDYTLAVIRICLLGLSLFLGAYAIPKEIEKQTCLVILNRPVSRFQFYLSKMISIVMIEVLLVMATLVLFFILYTYGSNDSVVLSHWLQIVLLLGLESLVMLSVVMALSVFTNPILAFVEGLALFVSAQFTGDFQFFANKTGNEAFIQLSKMADVMLPQLYRQKFHSYYFTVDGVDASSFIYLVSHFAVWIFIFLMVGQFRFSKKDLI